MERTPVQKLVLAGLFLALGFLMPFLTGQLQALGQQLLPMHLPVLLGGFVLGGPLGLAVGLVTPILRSLIFGMPPLFPTAVAMSFELAAYGFLTGFFYAVSQKSTRAVYASLIGAMIGGRIVWAAASLLLYGLAGRAFTWQVFLGGAFLNAVPGIIAQLILLPPLVLALKKGNFLHKS